MGRIAAAVAIVVLALPGAVRAEAMLLSVTYGVASDDPDAIDFLLDFDSAPQLTTADGNGLLIDEFQFYAPFGAEPLFVIRSGELPIRGTIVLRAAHPPSGDPGSGNWGPLRAEAPITMPTATSVQFRLPAVVGTYHLLSSYTIEMFHSGTVGQSASLTPGSNPIDFSSGPVVPEPSTLALVAPVLLAGLAWWSHRRRETA